MRILLYPVIFRQSWQYIIDMFEISTGLFSFNYFFYRKTNSVTLGEKIPEDENEKATFGSVENLYIFFQ